MYLSQNRTRPRRTVGVIGLLCFAIVVASNACFARPVDVIVNGAPVTLETAPAVVHDQLYMPLRELFGLLGAHVTWIPQAQAIVAYRGEDVFTLKPGSEVAEVNGTELILSNPPSMIGGSVFVPLRAVASLLGASVAYVNRTVDITIAPMDGPDRAPSAYAATIDRYARDSYSGRYIWAKSFDGHDSLSVKDEAWFNIGSVSYEHLERLQIVRILLFEDTSSMPWGTPPSVCLAEMRNAAGKTGWHDLHMGTHATVANYNEALSRHFYLDDPFKGRNWSKAVWDLVKANCIQIGMTPDMVRMSWGDPKRINRTIYSFGVHEQWVYGMSCYVYFEDGKVTTIQN